MTADLHKGHTLVYGEIRETAWERTFGVSLQEEGAELLAVTSNHYKFDLVSETVVDDYLDCLTCQVRVPFDRVKETR